LAIFAALLTNMDRCVLHTTNLYYITAFYINLSKLGWLRKFKNAYDSSRQTGVMLF